MFGIYAKRPFPKRWAGFACNAYGYFSAWYTVPTLHNTVSAVGKKSFMKRQQEEFTALYCRLSQDDGREGESMKSKPSTALLKYQ